MIALDGVFQGGTFSCICSWELSYRTDGNREKYLVMSGVRLFYSLVIFLCMLAIGFLMQVCTFSLIQPTGRFFFSWQRSCQSMRSCASIAIQGSGSSRQKRRKSQNMWRWLKKNDLQLQLYEIWKIIFLQENISWNALVFYRCEILISRLLSL